MINTTNTNLIEKNDITDNENIYYNKCRNNKTYDSAIQKL